MIETGLAMVATASASNPTASVLFILVCGIVGMARPPGVPDLFWRAICWIVGPVVGILLFLHGPIRLIAIPIVLLALVGTRAEHRAPLPDVQVMVGKLKFSRRKRIEIHPEPSQQWGDDPAWVQHILVTNRGQRGRFRASLTSDISGLEKPYGRAMRLLWEQTNSAEMELGHGEQGRLRLASFSSSGGTIEARFFAIPTSRHEQGAGYHPTQPYALTVPDLTFDVCVRNAESDETFERKARVIFSGNESRPRLSLWEERASEAAESAPDPGPTLAAAAAAAQPSLPSFSAEHLVSTTNVRLVLSGPPTFWGNDLRCLVTRPDGETDVLNVRAMLPRDGLRRMQTMDSYEPPAPGRYEVSWVPGLSGYDPALASDAFDFPPDIDEATDQLGEPA